MHTHYTLEEASNPPKERGLYVVLRKNGLRVELEYYPDDNDWSAYTDVIYWYRPVTEEERAKERAEDAAAFLWWYSIGMNEEEGREKIECLSYEDAYYLFDEEREKQKQQKGENNA